jgi:hypothetical protein
MRQVWMCVVMVAALVATGCQRTPSDTPAPKTTAPITVAAYYWPGMWQRTGELIRTHPDKAFAIVAEVNHQPIEAVRELR